MWKKIVVAVLPLAFCVSQVHAFSWTSTNATVSLVEASYAPNAVTFALTVMPSECTSGLLTWMPRGATQATQVDNGKAVLAGLLSALASGGPINVFGSVCNVEYIHLLKTP